PTMEQQQADALALVAETALHRGMDPGAPGERYQVVVHVGARVPAGTSQRLACDASRVVMRHDADGRITEGGARTRTIPPALRRALQHRDKGVASPAADCRSARAITFGTGRMAVRRNSRISRCSVDDTIVRFTKRAFRWSDTLMEGCAFGDRMGECWRTCRHRSQSERT